MAKFAICIAFYRVNREYETDDFCMTINEKDRVIDVMFLAEFCKKLIYESIVSCRFKLCME